MINIGILGGGSWATAMASLIGEKEPVIMYMRNEKDSEFFNENHENRKYLKGNKLSENVYASSDIKEVVENKEIIINAIPTQSSRDVLNQCREYVSRETIIMNISKGIEVNTKERISQIVEDILPNNTYAILSGPSHAEEVITKNETSIVIASKDENTRKMIQERLSRSYFRIYTNDDVIGVELGGALKNVLALGIGVANGLGVGDNGVAALITRGMYEMSKFTLAMGGRFTSVYGLAGLGDLIVTGTSKLSRNRKAGELLGKGYTLEEIQKEVGMAIEGIKTCEAVYEISKDKDIDMPISTEIYKMINEGQDPKESINKLMNRQMKDEFNIQLNKERI